MAMKSAILAGLVSVLVMHPSVATAAPSRAWTPAPQDTAKKNDGKNSNKSNGSNNGKAEKKQKADTAPPSPEKLAERKAEAEARALYTGMAPVEFTMTANFKSIGRDRDTLSTKRFAASVVTAGAGVRMDTIPVQLRTRGHFRLDRCSFVPLRVEFPKQETKGTVFEGVGAVKLGTHCEKDSEMEEYQLREYAAYRIYNMLTPRSYRARIAKVTYVDSASGKPMDTKYGMFVENDKDLGDRMGGKIKELRKALFDDVDEESINILSIFEYMIGNTDWSLYALHNVRLLQTDDGMIYPIAYDFDFSGLVGARYATPDPKLNIRSVKDRLFRGPCRTPEQLEPVIAKFKSIKGPTLALYDSLPGLNGRYRDDAKEYLGNFFRIIERPGDVKAELIENCNRKGGA